MPHGAVALLPIPTRRSQEPLLIGEPLADLLERHQVGPSRGQLDGQRQLVDSLHDGLDQLSVGGIQLEVRL
jgi:hypothetical protein